MRDKPVTLEEIAKVVKATLAKDFDKVTILNVKVEKALDDGEETLHIFVVFEGAPKDLDAAAVTGAVRTVRPLLAERGYNEFPLFSFISKSDVGAGKFAAE